MVPLRKAIELTGLSGNTLRKYADNGAIKSIRTPAGQRLFDIDSFLKQGRISATLCDFRVSSGKQREDLNRQVEKMRTLYPKAQIIKGIGSGLNFKPYWNAFCEEISSSLWLPHRDRLARFGFDLIRFLVEKNAGEILVLDRAMANVEDELTADLLTLLHHFSCRMHGMRSNLGKENKTLSNCHAKEAVQTLVRCIASSAQPDSGAPEPAKGEQEKALDGRSKNHPL